MKLILWLLPVLSFAQQEASAPDPRELMKQAADAMKKYQSYQLESTVAIDMHGGPINESFEMPSSISVRRPDKMRIESTNEGDEVIIVGDGEHTWFYISKVKKYVKRAAVESPEAAVFGSGLLPKNLPDLDQFVKSVKNTGEDTIDVDGTGTPCWVVQTIYNKINLAEQNVTISDGVQLTWISKDKKLTLKSSFGGTIRLPGVDENIDLTQSTRTTKVSLNVDLPDSLFTFEPPEEVKEAEDWTLPGLSRPDVIGKLAPAALAANKDKVVLTYFATSPCSPCVRELAAIDKIKAEFGAQGLVVMTPSADYPELELTAWPTVILIDRDGKIASYEVGARGEAALRDDLKKLGIGPKTP